MVPVDRPLVVGAGPVGLAAALFLAKQGQAPRVVEMREGPSGESRALAVNPRTLEILESTSVAKQMLEPGRPVRGARFYRGTRDVGGLSFAGIHPKYPFLLGLSQATSERLLTRALEATGGRVERGVKLVDCRPASDRVEAVLEHAGGGAHESVRCRWLLAADGAHSTARDKLGLQFRGSSFAREWHLADVPLRTPLEEDYGHIFFFDGGAFLFLLRVIDEALERQSPAPLWRVITNRPDPLSRLVRAEQAGAPVWTSSFHIAHRLSASFAAHHGYLAGDAAHSHSPLGARGMNLGVEDAYVFAELVRSGGLARYDQLRRPVDRRVVRRVELLSKVAAAETWPYQCLRATVLARLLKTQFFRRRMLAAATGLDHELSAPGAVDAAIGT
jgi:2-polyprenyl-6-methoxyphenol hydroxylase-like FAD-dependent oxidoreductase